MRVLTNDINFIRKIKEEPVFQDGNYTEFSPCLLIFNNEVIIENGLKNCFHKKIEPIEYNAFRAAWKQMKYKYKKGWINSKRQKYIDSTECISFIQETETGINAFLRSSNIDHPVFFNDIAFLATLLEKGELNVFVSIPHTWNNDKSKIENNGTT